MSEILGEDFHVRFLDELNEKVLRLSNRVVRSDAPAGRKPGGRKRKSASPPVGGPAAEGRHEDTSLKSPFPDDPDWTRVNWPRLIDEIAHKLDAPDYASQSRLAMELLPFLSAAWSCCLSGAAGAYLDLAAVLHEFNLSCPKAIQQRWEQAFCAASGSGSRFKGQHDAAFAAHRRGLKEFQRAFAAHRWALVQRLRYECVMRVLSGDTSLSGQGRILTGGVHYRRHAPVVTCLHCEMQAFDRDAASPSREAGQSPESSCDCDGRRAALASARLGVGGVSEAAEKVSRLLPEFSKPFFSTENKRTVTGGMVHKDYVECDRLWSIYLSELDKRPLFSPKSWPGMFYLPSPRTCERLGWSDLAQAYATLRVPSDDPLERSGLGLWLDFGTK